MKTKKQLYAFEEWCKKIYLEGRLRSPIHLSGSVDGNLEDFLIKTFKKIRKKDWVFSTYRSHYHALLKGVSESALKNWILDNKSIHFMSKKYKIFTSAIVGGTLPIALGVALAIKRRKGKEKVYVFCGDMTASIGTFKDVHKYANCNELPIEFIIEDNGLSTDTPTKKAWGKKESSKHWWEVTNYPNINYVKYTRKYPHYGIGEFVDFKDEKLKQDGKNF